MTARPARNPDAEYGLVLAAGHVFGGELVAILVGGSDGARIGSNMPPEALRVFLEDALAALADARLETEFQPEAAPGGRH